MWREVFLGDADVDNKEISKEALINGTLMSVLD
jgi:hypothetical protein